MWYMLIFAAFFFSSEKKNNNLSKKTSKKHMHLLVMNRNHPGFVSSSGTEVL